VPASVKFSENVVTMRRISATDADTPRDRGANACTRMSSMPPTQRMISGRIAFIQPGSRRG
jgi:hypothetical protein